MGFELVRGSNVLAVDTAGNAPVKLLDASGNPITLTDGGDVVATQQGVLTGGRDDKQVRHNRVSSFGTGRIGNETIFFQDLNEGANIDIHRWTGATSGMTVSQSISTGFCLNAGSATTLNAGAMFLSNKRVPFVLGCPIELRARIRYTQQFAGNVWEVGFGEPSAVNSASIANGAVWRVSGAGLQPILSIGGTEVTGTAISDATFRAAVPINSHAIFEIFIEGHRIKFNLFSQSGVLVNTQILYWTGPLAGFQTTRLRVLYRTYNASAPATAVQTFMYGINVSVLDGMSQRDTKTAMAALGQHIGNDPTTRVTPNDLSVSLGQTTRALSTTAAAEAWMGGYLVAASIAGSNTDLIMFAYQIPGPLTFFLTGIQIGAPINQVVAVATTATVFAYSFSVNSDAVSLNNASTYPPLLIPIAGLHTAAIATAVNAPFAGGTLSFTPSAPIPVHPGRFLHIVCREIVGTATATETYRWAVSVDGYWE